MQRNKKLAILCILIGIIGRLIPHPPNITPFTSLCIFSGTFLPRRLALIIMLISVTISDIALAYLIGYPIFSYWSLFTYTGFAAIVMIGSLLPTQPTISRLCTYGGIATGGFWIWTNFGVWLTSTLYPHTATGLAACYTAALPYLGGSVLGNFIWLTIIFGIYKTQQIGEYSNAKS